MYVDLQNNNYFSYCYDSIVISSLLKTNFKFYDFGHVVRASVSLLAISFGVVWKKKHIIRHLPLIRPLCASRHTLSTAETLSSDAFSSSSHSGDGRRCIGRVATVTSLLRRSWLQTALMWRRKMRYAIALETRKRLWSFCPHTNLR